MLAVFFDTGSLQDELSGADIKAVCTEAGLLALRERRMRVTQVGGWMCWRPFHALLCGTSCGAFRFPVLTPIPHTVVSHSHCVLLAVLQACTAPFLSHAGPYSRHSFRNGEC